ncbi:MAG TPA: aminopeptidase [Candidatus Nanoarchaeia archaeon]|nr:aminopeptidase [Candidatus Nanoarchaeia archaeon]
MVYHPQQEILDKYADVLVNFALGGGKGVRKGEVVFIQVPECAKPLLISLQKAVLKAGAHYITQYLPDETERHFYELAQDHHLDFFPEEYLKARVNTMDHLVSIIADVNKQILKGIPPEKIMRKSRSHKPYMDWRTEKENNGKLTWTLALYGTAAAAKEAGLSEEEYWNQIISACYLDKKDPVAEWKKSFAETERVKKVLDNMEIDKLHVEAEGVDLWVGLGEKRKWLAGMGRNIPSFELFISPDWRRTQGHIEFDQPLYRYGNIVKGIKIDFKEGKVVNCSADEGEEVLKKMIEEKNADKIGEFSLTDKRLSKISKFMAETLFDENFGGEYGNTHIALGNAYKDSYPGDASKVSKEEWDKLGYNESVVHTDIVSTRNRKVTAYMKDGKMKIIYKDGIFLV